MLPFPKIVLILLFTAFLFVLGLITVRIATAPSPPEHRPRLMRPV